MSRKKKARSGGHDDVIVVRNRTQSDVEGRERKKQKKRKGLKTGSRNADAKAKQAASSAQARDPRLGSKKKIPLVVETVKPSKQQRKLSAQKELELLESDAQLMVLLERLENGEKLGAGLQKYVDEKLDRIEQLMDQLGLLVEDEEAETETGAEVQPQPVKAKKPAAPRSDEDLLSDFEQQKWDEF
ncbi:Der GTPase-activating protein YihI [Vibrio sp.]|uniref:Der GTPase-activating protein YihI n=1 Tax=Vibrio sp. TaxID=678 RepID=UPI003D121573